VRRDALKLSLEELAAAAAKRTRPLESSVWSRETSASSFLGDLEAPAAAPKAVAKDINTAEAQPIPLVTIGAAVLAAVAESSVPVTLWHDKRHEGPTKMVSDAFADLAGARREVLVGKDLRCLETHGMYDDDPLFRQRLRLADLGAIEPISGVLVRRKMSSGELFRTLLHVFSLPIPQSEDAESGEVCRLCLGVWLNVGESEGEIDETILTKHQSEIQLLVSTVQAEIFGAIESLRPPPQPLVVFDAVDRAAPCGPGSVGQGQWKGVYPKSVEGDFQSELTSPTLKAWPPPTALLGVGGLAVAAAAARRRRASEGGSSPWW